MDDLLDLNWSSNTNGNNSKNGQKSSYNAFDSLAAAARTNTANYHGLNSGRSPSPATVISPVSAKSNGNSANDAFSSLFSDTTASARQDASKQSSLSMQQRLEVQRSGSGSSSGPRGPGNSQAAPNDLWDFDMLSSAPVSASSNSSRPKTSSSPAGSSNPFDDLDAFAPSVKSPVTSPLSTQISSHHDTDDFLGVLSQPVSAFERSRSPEAIRNTSPTMAAPTPLRALEANNKSASSTRPPSRAVAARTPSPPPHILGQVVAMGFSLQQARLALAATLQSGAAAGTESQWDVQAAVEVLTSDGAANAERARSPRSAKSASAKSSKTHGATRPEFRDDEMDEYERKEARRAQLRAKERSGEGQQRRGSSSLSPNADSQSDDQSPDLLAQASSIGFSVLKSANAYWKTSKAQIAKAVEENKFLAATAEKASSGRTTPNTGRPKWMTADMDDGEIQARSPARSEIAKGKMPQQASFSDMDNRHDEQVQARSARLRADSPPQRKQQPVTNLWDEADDVLAPHPSDRPAAARSQPAEAKAHLKPPEKEKAAYISPHRRKAPMPSASRVTPSSSAATAAPMRNGSSKPAQNPQRPARIKPTATDSQLSASKDARTRGNEHFKLGRYGEAVDAYTSALTPLPESHLARIPVLNNRANARLRIGEERKAAEDATAVIILLLGDTIKPNAARKDDYTSMLAELESIEVSAGEDKLDAPDALGKAFSRRARGHEAGEKWRLALLDWQMIAELGDQRVLKSAGGMRVVSEGLARCRKVVEGPAEPVKQAVHKPPAARVPPKPVSAEPAKPSAALTALRQGNQQAEADESEAIRVKDSVDAKITSWRAGKEANLRALIGSLDNVLWEELGWKKVGMHELLTEGQLKVKYVRAISKVHPDKIGKSATVEQRMIAGAVFSTLSDAWAAMK